MTIRSTDRRDKDIMLQTRDEEVQSLRARVRFLNLEVERKDKEIAKLKKARSPR